jgi:hypothetical protein
MYACMHVCMHACMSVEKQMEFSLLILYVFCGGRE